MGPNEQFKCQYVCFIDRNHHMQFTISPHDGAKILHTLENCSDAVLKTLLTLNSSTPITSSNNKDLTQSWKREPNIYLWLSHLFRIRLRGLCQKTRMITENPGIVILSDIDSISCYTKRCVYLCLLKPLCERSKIISNIAS